MSEAAKSKGAGRFCTVTPISWNISGIYLYYDHFRAQPGYLQSISANLPKLFTICFKTIERSKQLLFDLKTDSLSLPSLKQIRLEECNERLDHLDDLASSLENLRRDCRTKHSQFSFNGKLICSPHELRLIASLIRAHDSETSEGN